MSLLDIHREINRRTRIKTTKHRKRLFLISTILSALFTFAWYETGIIQTSPIYHDLSPTIGLWFTLFQTFLGISMLQIIITYFITAGEYTAPRIIEGYWKAHSRIVIPEKVRSLTANGIWKYVVLHRKHDPLYQADLEQKADKTEVDEWKKLTSDFIKRFSDHFATKAEVRELKKELKEVKDELAEYKKKDSVKKEQIGENIDAQDINENTKIDDQNKKFERKN